MEYLENIRSRVSAVDMCALSAVSSV